MSDAIETKLRPYLRRGVLAPLDVELARGLCRMAGITDWRVALAAALASRAPRHGHVYADLSKDDAIRVEEDEAEDTPPLEWPNLDRWSTALLATPLAAPPGSEPTPLVLAEERLYLYRYWRYEQRLGLSLLARSRELRDVDPAACRDLLERLFPKSKDVPEPNLQRVAAAVAALRGLSVVTGGPGTGKTTTVLRLLALLASEAARRDERLRIALAAPTGKAAARMAEAIRDGTKAIDLPPEILAAIPAEASTLHRLLGFQRHRPTAFRHDRDNPLPFDVLVVDEASMIPLALMAKLVDAVPPAARLVLLGDRDQLASVEAGAVLGDLCQPEEGGLPGFSPAFADRLGPLLPDLPESLVGGPAEPGLHDCIVHLEHSFRFDEEGGIGRLAAEVNAGSAQGALEVLTTAKPKDPVALLSSETERGLRDKLKKLVLAQLAPVPKDASPKEALEAVGRFAVLCAHRKGRLGAGRLNRDIEGWLAAEGRLDPSTEHYPGRPVMVTENDYSIGLFNGDIGIVLEDEDTKTPYVAFPTADTKGYRSVAPGRLPPHETVFAMTVHKSQGSEFDRIAVVLPAEPSRVLTRELLYTALTRAREHVAVLGPPDVITHAIAERVQRASGLRTVVWPG